MKQVYLSFLLTMLLCMLGTDMLAHALKIKNADGVTIYYNWIYNGNGTELEVTYPYDGNSYYYYSGNVVIPETVEYKGNTYRVTSIGNNAFYKCSTMTSITIPNSVTSIGKEAFINCSGLTSVTIPNSVTSIGEWAFSGCSGLTSVHISDIENWCKINFSAATTSNPLYYAKHLFINGVEIKDLVIPNSITSINNCIFAGCEGLISVTIPNSVTSIGNSAFYGCSGLTSIAIPNSVSSIGHDAFYGCCSLTSITIPNKVATIEDNTFRDCTGLTSVIIPYSVTSIGECAFYQCGGLTSVEIPNSVTSIGSGAFSGCSGLTSVEITNSVTSIENSTFYGCHSLTSIEIPNSVTSIGYSAFENCRGLTSIDIPNSVTSIGKSAFSGCTSLTSITIPNSVTRIEPETFAWSGLVSITIPNSVTSIGKGAFENCYSLTSVSIPNSVTRIESETFAWSGLISITIPNSVTSIEKDAFSHCSNLLKVQCYAENVPKTDKNAFSGTTTSVITLYVPESAVNAYSSSYPWSDFGDIKVIGSATDDDYKISGSCGFNVNYYYDKLTHTLTIIGEGGMDNYSSGNAPWFSYAETIQTLDLKSGLRSIGNRAFEGCTSLDNISIPNTVTCIGKYAFSGCYNLSFVTISKRLTIIEDYAFNDCMNLQSVTIPNSLTFIGKKVFDKCIRLWGVISFIENPFQVDIFSDDIYPYSVLYVPIGSREKYKATKGWNKFKKIEEGTDYVDGLTPDDPIVMGVCGPNVYYTYDKSNHKLIIYGEGEIRKYTSYDADQPWYSYSGEIQSISIEDGVTSIGEFAFYGCRSLTSLSLPNSLTVIDYGAFINCSSLISLYIPSNVTFISVYAFEGCSSLTSITVQDGNSVYDSREDCNAIISKSDNTLLFGCKNTIIPNSVTSIGNYAFSGCSGLTSVTIPNSVTSIGYDAFYGCSSLTSIDIPNSVTSIGISAFRDCSGLTSVTIPNSVTSIGEKAFGFCNSLVDVYCYAESIPNTNKAAFYYTPTESATLHVPDNMIEEYKQVSPWNSFGTIVGLSNTGIKTIRNDNDKSDALIFDMQGNKLDNLHKGLNIIRHKDGKTKKVVVR